MTLCSWLAELLHPLRASREELDAVDETRGATRRGTVPIGQIDYEIGRASCRERV